MSERIKCPFRLRNFCYVSEYVPHSRRLEDNFVKLYCSMCVKSIYAKAKLIASKTNYKVVNTL